VKVCISVDLDNYQDYQSLVDTELDGEPRSFYADAIPRFLDVFDRCGVKATFFAIGRDAVRAENARILREIAERGHEVGNHSFTHPYNFRQLNCAEKVLEIDQGAAVIADAIGERPVGFRTPSCEISLETLSLLAERGYLYDSSVFPTPVMWAFMIYGLLFVKHARYQLGHPIAALAPRLPYLPSPDALHRRRRAGDERAPWILEIPFSTFTPVGVPFYSTLMRRLGTRFFGWAVRSYRRRSEVLHALYHMIEFANFDGTALEAAMARTPALGLSFAERQRFLTYTMERLSEAGDCVTLRDFAQRHQVEQGWGVAT